MLAQKASAKKAKTGPVKETRKKGTIAGAIALIIGTSIGSGILALPEKASPAVITYLSAAFTS